MEFPSEKKFVAVFCVKFSKIFIAHGTLYNTACLSFVFNFYFCFVLFYLLLTEFRFKYVDVFLGNLLTVSPSFYYLYEKIVGGNVQFCVRQSEAKLTCMNSENSIVFK